jgi:hypothetical protein
MKREAAGEQPAASAPGKQMTKAKSRLSVREQKSEALDVFVKKELASTKAADLAKMGRLRALRLAREEQQIDEAVPDEKDKGARAKRKTMHLRSAG